MSTLAHKIKTMLTTPRIFWIKFAHSPLFRYLPDKTALEIQFQNTFHRKIDWDNPKSFNEKLQWLKLYDRKPEYTTMVDKYAAKEYAASIIGEEHIIPTLGVWDSFDDIDFKKLPNQFVLKCTHGSGDVVICRDKKSFNIDTAREKLTKALKTDYYMVSREWPYKNVPRRIIAEKYMTDLTGPAGLIDYKMMCFSGKVKCTFVCENRFEDSGLTVTVYDSDWVRMDVRRETDVSKSDRQRPATYERMKELAEKLSERLVFSRIDFYEIDKKVWWGEITLYPAGGMEHFYPEEWDYKLGEWIHLPEEKV